MPKYTQRLNIKCEPALKNNFLAYANKNNISLSEFIREVAMETIKRKQLTNT